MANENQIVKSIKNRDIAAFSEFADRIKYDKKKQIWFYDDPSGKGDIDLTNATKMSDAEFRKLKVQAKEYHRTGHNEYDRFFKNLGICAVLRSANSIKETGKNPDHKKLMEDIKNIDFDDIYDLAFEDDKSIKKGQYNDKTPDNVMKSIARRVAIETLKQNEKIDSAKYDELVKADDDGFKEYSNDIASDAATKNKYMSLLNEYQDEFEKGVADTRKDIAEGRDVKEPYTNRTLKLEDGEFESALKNYASAAAKGIGNIVGISENNNDFFSKLVFMAIGGGKALWKRYQKQKALDRFKNYKQVRVSKLKKLINDAVKEATPLIKNVLAKSEKNDADETGKSK